MQTLLLLLPVFLSAATIASSKFIEAHTKDVIDPYVLLEKFNGERVTSLVHLKRLLEAAEAAEAAAVQGAVVLAGTAAPSPTSASATELLPSLPPPAGIPHPFVFEFATGQVIVIDADRASAVRGELCRDHGMSFPWSPDLE